MMQNLNAIGFNNKNVGLVLDKETIHTLNFDKLDGSDPMKTVGIVDSLL